MEVFLTLLALLLVFLFYPYARFAWKRISFCIRLKAVCRKRGFMLKPSHLFWLFGNFNGERCDFYVQTFDIVYAVKLCGGTKKSIIDFVDATHYARCSLHFLLTNAVHSAVPRVKSKKRFDFLYRFPEEAYASRLIPVILMNPVPLKVTDNGRGVGNGDFVEEGYFYNAAGFLKKLREETQV